VLVIDLHLPDTTGLELLPRLRQAFGLPDAPAFLCSADDPAQARQPALDAGFCGYWPKPVDLPAMLADLSRLAPGSVVRP
jgi:CheY-like chemotaxis protein